MKFLKRANEPSLADNPALARRLEAISSRGKVEAAVHEHKLGNFPVE
jgi:hypothetical protein